LPILGIRMRQAGRALARRPLCAAVAALTVAAGLSLAACAAPALQAMGMAPTVDLRGEA